MSYFRECPYCGANLDPGEHCDCLERQRRKEHHIAERQREAVRLAESEGMWAQEELSFV